MQNQNPDTGQIGYTVQCRAAGVSVIDHKVFFVNNFINQKSNCMKKRMLPLMMMALITMPLMLTSQTVLFSENFDTFTTGAYLTISNNQFQTWSNSPGGTDDVNISDEQSYSSPNSVKFYAASAQGNGDIVWKLDNKTGGHYNVEFKIYIGNQPAEGGYFNMLHVLPSSAEWAFSLTFNPNLNLDFSHDSVLTTIGTYTKGTWIDILIDINLNADSAYLYINNVMMKNWQWSIQESGGTGLKQLAGVNFFTYAGGGPNSNVLYYIDDVKFTQIIYPGIRVPLQSELVRLYPNPASDEINLSILDAQEVDIYTMNGQWTCRIPVFNNRADISHLAPGIYTARIITAETVHQSRIVKQ